MSIPRTKLTIALKVQPKKSHMTSMLTGEKCPQILPYLCTFIDHWCGSTRLSSGRLMMVLNFSTAYRIRRRVFSCRTIEANIQDEGNGLDAITPRERWVVDLLEDLEMMEHSWPKKKHAGPYWQGCLYLQPLRRIVHAVRFD